MTAATSTKSKSFFGTRFRNNIAANKKQLIINSILQILGLPVIAVCFLVTMYYEELGDAVSRRTFDAVEASCSTFAIVGIVAIAISLFMGMPIALSQFAYLYKKTITDMNYALPLSGKQRFFADYLSGISMYVLPDVCSFVLAIGIMGIGSIFVDTSEFWSIFPSLLSLWFIVIIAMLQFYTLSVFAISFCGKTFESSFSIIAFNTMIPATIACIWLAICKSSAYGIMEDSIFMNSFFTSTSPAGAAIFFVNYAAEISYLNGIFNEYTQIYVTWIISSLIVTAAYLAVAYVLCKFRKAESVSKPYVYKSFFYVIMSMMVFCILSLFISFDGVLSAGILLCAIIWFIMEVITRRGFKKFWQAGIGFAASVASVIIICQLCSLTNGFGMSKRIPAASTVSSVTISCSSIMPNSCYDIKFRDKDVINAAVELQKECVDRHFNPDNYSYTDFKGINFYKNRDCNIRIKYSLVSGSNMRREYRVESCMTDELIKAILLSDEYAKAAANSILINAIYGNQIGKELEIYDKSFSSHSPKRISKDEESLIINAYESDLKAMTEDELINGSIYCYLDDKWVLDSFTATKDVLHDLGIDLKNDKYSSFNIEVIPNPVFSTEGKYLFDGSESYEYDRLYDRLFVADNNSITNVCCGYFSSSNDEVSITVSDKYASQVIENAYPIIIGERPLAVVSLNDSELYLRDTDENRKLIENIK